MSADGLYLYGLMRGADAGPVVSAPIPGGGDVSILEAGEIAVLASALPAEPVRRTRRNLLAHAKVLEIAMADRTVLPMRFGIMAEDAEAVRRKLAPRMRELGGLLDRFDGLAEFGLRIGWPRESVMRALAAERPDLARRRDALGRQGAAGHYGLIDLGRDVAEALADRRARAQRTLLAALAPLAAGHVLRAPETDVEALRAEILLAPEREVDFLAAVAAAAAAMTFAVDAAPEIRWIGPSPVWTFATMQLDRPDFAPARASSRAS